MERNFSDYIFLAKVRVTTGTKLHSSGCDAYTDTEIKDDLRRYHVHLDDNRDFYALVHECHHLVYRILRDRNIEASDELLAYYQSYWVKTIWREIGWPKKKKRKGRNAKPSEGG